MAITRTAVLLFLKKMQLIGRGEKGAQMVIKPPGDAGRRAVFEVYDRVLITGEVRLLKECTRPMHQPVKAVVCIGANALAVEAHEERSRTRSVKAPVVIKNANLQNSYVPLGK
jgi:hypothetical protein